MGRLLDQAPKKVCVRKSGIGGVGAGRAGPVVERRFVGPASLAESRLWRHHHLFYLCAMDERDDFDGLFGFFDPVIN
jgi:hypothetical protein